MTSDLVEGLAELAVDPDVALGKNDTGGGKANAAGKAIQLALDAGATFFQTPLGDLYTTIDQHGMGGPRENWPIRSKLFKAWLSGEFYKAHSKGISSEGLSTALSSFEGMAINDQTLDVRVRVAGDDTAVFIDIADAARRCIRIDATGIQIVAAPPDHIRFYRPAGVKALPEPAKTGDVTALRLLVNVGDDRQWEALQAWIVSSLSPSGPYGILHLLGEQGSAKSMTSRIVRGVIDPSSVPLDSLPRNERDLAIRAEASWALCIDNVGKLPDWLSDCLCRIATGGGFRTRELYLDKGETLFDFQRPVVINSIKEVVIAQDMLARSLPLNLPVIEARLTERELREHVKREAPEILTGFLNAVAVGIKRLPTILSTYQNAPRMADMFLWSQACSPALDVSSGSFEDAFDVVGKRASAAAVEACPIGAAIFEFHAGVPDWIGYPQDLLERLEGMLPLNAAGNHKKPKEWPTNAWVLVNQLREFTTLFRENEIGVEIAGKLLHGRRQVRIHELI